MSFRTIIHFFLGGGFVFYLITFIMFMAHTGMALDVQTLLKGLQKFHLH